MSTSASCVPFNPIVAARRASPHATSRLTPLMLGLSGALVLAPGDAAANNLIVNNCLDDGSVGSLRYEVDHAASGDVIDLSTPQLTCSTITLTNGAIASSLEQLTFQGPSDRALTITNGGSGTNRRIFSQNNVKAALRIDYLTITGGYYYGAAGTAKGGCIYSSYGVRLDGVVVSDCYARTYNSHLPALGGGVFANVTLYMWGSRVTGNRAYSLADASGGGIYAGIETQIVNSTISGNSAVSEFGLAAGGGVKCNGGMEITLSTVDSNHAQVAGGLWSTKPFIYDSTISGNSAALRGGGVYAHNAFVLANSTIAFNAAAQGGGIYAKGAGAFVAHSAIIARNIETGASGFADVYIVGASLSGTNNLVMSYNLGSSAITVTSDPQLTPLGVHAYVGNARTRTHALLATSPAIDHGDNLVPLPYDQRAQPREVPTGKPDIGAYERQVNDDEIYYGGFD